jgi:uncharacterized protein (DUF427 family)
VRDYPRITTPVDTVEPTPRWIRGFLNGTMVFDTARALYVWERPHCPQCYIPLADVNESLLVDQNRSQKGHRGTAHFHGLRSDTVERPSPGRPSQPPP